MMITQCVVWIVCSVCVYWYWWLSIVVTRLNDNPWMMANYTFACSFNYRCYRCCCWCRFIGRHYNTVADCWRGRTIIVYSTAGYATLIQTICTALRWTTHCRQFYCSRSHVVCSIGGCCGNGKQREKKMCNSIWCVRVWDAYVCVCMQSERASATTQTGGGDGGTNGKERRRKQPNRALWECMVYMNFWYEYENGWISENTQTHAVVCIHCIALLIALFVSKCRPSAAHACIVALPGQRPHASYGLSYSFKVNHEPKIQSPIPHTQARYTKLKT